MLPSRSQAYRCVYPIFNADILLSVPDLKGRRDGARLIANLAPNRILDVGLAAVPEGNRVLTDLTVEENLRAAGALMHGAKDAALADTYACLPELAERRNQLAGTLSGVQQQMVALSYALMCRPKYLLIDEMSFGLAPMILQRLTGFVEDLKRDGLGIVLIEQFTDLALKVGDDAVVPRSGIARFAGKASELKDDPSKLDRAYFG